MSVIRPDVADLALDPSCVEEQMQLLEKALRATQLYLPNNPMYQHALTNASRGLAGLWETLDELSLRVTREGFEWEGHPVLHGREQAECMAWTLYKDGVRTLVFLPGAESEEVIRFLDVVNRAKALDANRPRSGDDEVEDDLLTLLWTEDFRCIRYDFIELGDDDLPALNTSETFGGFAPPDQLRQEIAEDAATAPETSSSESPPGLANIDDFDSTLYFLDPREIDYIKGEIDAEYRQDLSRHVLEMLFDILEFQTYHDARDRVLDVLEHLVPHLLSLGTFASVAYTLSEARTAVRELDCLTEAQRKRLAAIPLQISSPATLGQLLQVLDDIHWDPTDEELAELFAELDPSSLATILGWIPRLRNDRVRGALERAVDPMARRHPEAVVWVLTAGDPEAVVGGLGIVTRLQLQTIGTHLARLTEHPDPRVRLALVEALRTLGTPTAMQQLVTMVGDAARDVRIAAVKSLTARHHTPAVPTIEVAVSEKLRGTDLSEKMAFFEAYGALGRESSVPILEAILINKGFLRRKDDPETRACAAMALGKAGPSARDVLERVGRDKDPLVRNAVDKARRELRG